MPTPGVAPNYPQAWNDATGMEIGDKRSGSGKLKSSTGKWTAARSI